MNIRDRYLGSSLGSIWAILNPLLMLGIYTFVFGYVFKAKIPGSSTTLGYAIWLISGYGSWIATTEAIMAATNSVVAGAGLIKNIAFKTELLPVASSLTGLVPLLVSICFMFILLVIDKNVPSWHILFLVPLLILQFLFIIGCGFFFSAINVFVRDFGIILPNLLTMLLFATPIFYPTNVIPEFLKIISAFNPFYILADAYRQSMIYHQIPSLISLVYVGVISGILNFLGMRFFHRLKGHFEAML